MIKVFLMVIFMTGPQGTTAIQLKPEFTTIEECVTEGAKIEMDMKNVKIFCITNTTKLP